MTKGKHLVSSGEDTKLSSASGEEETDYFCRLSIDSAVNIFSRLPLKTIAKCRCVSKLWSSIIRPTNYYQLAVITNPITQETFTTPKVKKQSSKSKVKFYFGNDPTDNQFKVLCVKTFSPYEKNSSSEYQVVTLGTGNLVWRKIQCSMRFCAVSNDNGICINGVLYHKADKQKIACFDVKTEIFYFINISQDMELEYLNLIDYKGKLGASNSNRTELWDLEDAWEHKWSKHSYEIPRLFYSVSFAGTIGSGEIVLHRKYEPVIGFYNVEKNTTAVVRVGCPTHEWFKRGIISIFTNFVEEVKLM